MNLPDLLRCPFCGGPAAYRRDKTGVLTYAGIGHMGVPVGAGEYQATCVDTNGCGVNTQWYKTPEQAALIWNKRTPAEGKT